MARKRLIWSSDADSDLLDIWDYLAREASPATADRRLRAIHEACARLRDWPRLGAPRDQFRPGLRSIPVPPHIVFYRENGPAVEVVRVLHGSRDLEAIFTNNPKR